ncbi:MAG: hypothetical protein DRP15_04115 [Candidatus Aenigmatarchaeota archaeon]|nr:MAG: hypothetical protein DRP15_04115 [Candidatus Aenigmarchaeota archaeon]
MVQAKNLVERLYRISLREKNSKSVAQVELKNLYQEIESFLQNTKRTQKVITLGKLDEELVRSPTFKTVVKISNSCKKYSKIKFTPYDETRISSWVKTNLKDNGGIGLHLKYNDEGKVRTTLDLLLRIPFPGLTVGFHILRPDKPLLHLLTVYVFPTLLPIPSYTYDFDQLESLFYLVQRLNFV